MAPVASIRRWEGTYLPLFNWQCTRRPRDAQIEGGRRAPAPARRGRATRAPDTNNAAAHDCAATPGHKHTTPLLYLQLGSIMRFQFNVKRKLLCILAISKLPSVY
ncbi:hypothetical protein PAHAL_2G349000 [Panicum hallii]|uniref:Uncharacterized protein n=1 Tax=Panicum hallii TaxID=206008 RepID=A0A2S3H1T0_9POAL|nr:hypothetical protein PAHAL_2G349000 [Panicum hallii]